MPSCFSFGERRAGRAGSREHLPVDRDDPVAARDSRHAIRAGQHESHAGLHEAPRTKHPGVYPDDTRARQTLVPGGPELFHVCQIGFLVCPP